MKKVLLATTALVAAAVTAPASAADMRPALKAPPPIARPLCAQFGGFYVGAHIGWAAYDYNWNDQDGWAKETNNQLPGEITTSRQGWLGGVAGGYNWQQGCALWGVEADWSWTGLRAEKDHVNRLLDIEDSEIVEGSTHQLTVRSRIRGLFTLRSRLGVVVDNVLLYVTGGFAAARFNRQFEISQPGDPTVDIISNSRTRWGGVVGAGAEWAFSPNVSIKSEFLYAKFARDRFSVSNVGDDADDCTTPCRFENNDSVLISKIGINFRWGGFGAAPVAARF
jgi:outer membrane immunogenic protein